MLALLNHSVALTIALAYLLALLFGPFLAAWFLLRIARDLRRIADALYPRERGADVAFTLANPAQHPLVRDTVGRVSNSMFAR